MLKATAGGGGRSIRVDANAEELEAQCGIAAREAHSAFGYGRLYLERVVGMVRRVEVQILADGERANHLFERECSLRRRRQQLVEEAPSPSLDDDVRLKRCSRRCGTSAAGSSRSATFKLTPKSQHCKAKAALAQI